MLSRNTISPRLIVVFACICASASAFAAGHDKGSSASSGSPSGPGGGSSGSRRDEVDGETLTAEGQPADRDVLAKPWEVGGVFETHRLFIQTDLAGAGNNKLVNYLHLYGRWDFGKWDAIELRGYVYERFLADPGETGLRFDDTVLHFSHRFQGLPDMFGLRAYVNVTAPTSFYSQLMSLYTAPRLGVEASFHKGRFSASILAYAETFITKYRQMEGGNPNPWLHGALYLDAVYRLPILASQGEPLSVGVVLTGHRTWMREAGGGGTQPNLLGVQLDATYDTQPVQGSYGGDVYVRYQLPNLGGFRSDVSVAYAQGDPTLGFTSSMHDGVTHTYFFWRQSSQLFLALSGRY